MVGLNVLTIRSSNSMTRVDVSSVVSGDMAMLARTAGDSNPDCIHFP